MRRLALIVVGAAALGLTACQNQQTEARVEEPYTPLERMDATTSAEDAYMTEPTSVAAYPAEPALAAEQPETAADEMLDADGGRTYVVQKGDTLFALARQYYNDQSKWKAIWEANRTRIPDPNLLPVGVKLIIP